MAFGYVVTDDNYKVEKIIPANEFHKYKTVDDVEIYNVGDTYPKYNLDDYSVVCGKFVNGLSDKEYAFRCYCDDRVYEDGIYALVDTQYGIQIIEVTAVYEKEEWKGVTPTRDVIDVLCDYDGYLEREEVRKKEARKKTDEIKRKLEKQNKEDNVIRIKLDEEEKDKFVKLIESMFNDWPSILS